MQTRIDRLTLRLETTAVVALCAAAAALAVALDGFHHLVALAQRHETYRLDAVFSVLLVLGVVLTAVSIRRTRQLHRELALRAAAEAAGTLTDVTLRRQAAEALCASEARYAEQSARLNATLENLLLDSDLSTEQRRHVETIQECSDALLELMGDVIDVSKLEAERLDRESSEFDVVEVAETVLDIVEARARAKDLLVVFAPSPELPERVLGDPRRLRQSLLRLMGNAIQFTDSGSVVLRAYPRHDGDSAFVRFEVQDTGIGIPEHARDRLFQEFNQLEAGRLGLDSRPGQGSTVWLELPLPAVREAPAQREPLGAGRRVVLAALGGPGRDAVAALLVSHGFEVVRPADAAHQRVDLALLHHAALPQARFARRGFTATPWIAFGFGAGRCAGAVDGIIDGAVKPSHLAATLAEVLERTGARKDSPRPRPKLAARKLRVLLVEDNHVNQRVAARILKRMGHEADLAADGVEALTRAQARAYDVVLMDMRMPRMDGLAATRAIRALPGDAARVPIVAMTANAFASDRDACFAAGMDDFVAKPINRNKLFTILECLSERGPRTDANAPSSVVRLQSVDRQQLWALRDELGGEMLEELLASFRTSAADLMRQIEAALARDAFDAADDLLHRLKGSAMTLSFAGVAQACDDLGRIMHADNGINANEGLAALRRSLAGCDELLRSPCANLQAAAA